MVVGGRISRSYCPTIGSLEVADLLLDFFFSESCFPGLECNQNVQESRHLSVTTPKKRLCMTPMTPQKVSTNYPGLRLRHSRALHSFWKLNHHWIRRILLNQNSLHLKNTQFFTQFLSLRRKSITLLPPPEIPTIPTIRPWKSMVGRWSCSFEMVTI